MTTRRVLAALAAELDRNRDGVETLAALVSDYVRDCDPAARPAAVVRAQAIDELGQALDALAGFARSVSTGEAPADAARAAPLSDLGARLLAACEGDAVPSPPASSGDLEWLD